MGEDNKPNSHPLESRVERFLRRWVPWLALLGVLAYGGFHTGYILWLVLTQHEWLLANVIGPHYAAVIVMPSMAYFTLVLLLYFKWQKVPLDVEGPGFKFHGMAGPIVIWLLAMIAFSASVKLLW